MPCQTGLTCHFLCRHLNSISRQHFKFMAIFQFHGNISALPDALSNWFDLSFFCLTCHFLWRHLNFYAVWAFNFIFRTSSMFLMCPWNSSSRFFIHSKFPESLHFLSDCSSWIGRSSVRRRQRLKKTIFELNIISGCAWLQFYRRLSSLYSLFV